MLDELALDVDVVRRDVGMLAAVCANVEVADVDGRLRRSAILVALTEVVLAKASADDVLHELVRDLHIARHAITECERLARIERAQAEDAARTHDGRRACARLQIVDVVDIDMERAHIADRDLAARRTADGRVAELLREHVEACAVADRHAARADLDLPLCTEADINRLLPRCLLEVQPVHGHDARHANAGRMRTEEHLDEVLSEEMAIELVARNRERSCRSGCRVTDVHGLPGCDRLDRERPRALDAWARTARMIRQHIRVERKRPCTARIDLRALLDLQFLRRDVDTACFIRINFERGILVECHLAVFCLQIGIDCCIPRRRCRRLERRLCALSEGDVVSGLNVEVRRCRRPLDVELRARIKLKVTPCHEVNLRGLSTHIHVAAHDDVLCRLDLDRRCETPRIEIDVCRPLEVDRVKARKDVIDRIIGDLIAARDRVSQWVVRITDKNVLRRTHAAELEVGLSLDTAEPKVESALEVQRQLIYLELIARQRELCAVRRDRQILRCGIAIGLTDHVVAAQRDSLLRLDVRVARKLGARHGDVAVIVRIADLQIVKLAAGEVPCSRGCRRITDGDVLRIRLCTKFEILRLDLPGRDGHGVGFQLRLLMRLDLLRCVEHAGTLDIELDCLCLDPRNGGTVVLVRDACRLQVATIVEGERALVVEIGGEMANLVPYGIEFEVALAPEEQIVHGERIRRPLRHAVLRVDNERLSRTLACRDGACEVDAPFGKERRIARQIRDPVDGELPCVSLISNNDVIKSARFEFCKSRVIEECTRAADGVGTPLCPALHRDGTRARRCRIAPVRDAVRLKGEVPRACRDVLRSGEGNRRRTKREVSVRRARRAPLQGDARAALHGKRRGCRGVPNRHCPRILRADADLLRAGSDEIEAI